MKIRLAILGILVFSACSSTPSVKSPDWIRTPSRTVDGGYILFVGTGEDPVAEKSTFKAESQALQDLSNECSFAPKGTRIEDHYQEKSGGTILTYAKIGISFLDCDAAKAANDPESIRRLASAPLADQLKKYRDLVYAPAETEGGDTKGGSEGNPMLSSTAGPPTNPDHYFIARERVAYVKETIILAPETVYVPSAPQTVAVTRQLSAASDQVRVYEQKNPDTKTWHRSWSQFERNPSTELPASMPHLKSVSGGRPRPSSSAEKKKAPKDAKAAAPSAPPKPKKKRRRNPV